MPFIRTKIKEGRKYRYLVENYWDKEKKSSRQRVIQYLGVDTGEDGSRELIPPAHKMEEIERAIPMGKFGLYYAAAQYIGLREALEVHCPSQSFRNCSISSGIKFYSAAKFRRFYIGVHSDAHLWHSLYPKR
jgi:hypothetical protein